MYLLHTALERKNHYRLPLDYEIDGMLAFWTYDKLKIIPIFESTLEKLGIKYYITEHDWFLSEVTAYHINQKIYWFWVFYWCTIINEIAHLACMFWSSKNILAGYCGWLNEELNNCDIIVPTYSYSIETACSIYNRSWDSHQNPNIQLSQQLISALPINYWNKIYHKPVITCQAMLWETRDDVIQWNDEWYRWVEMESASLFAVSNHFNVPSSAMLIVVDNLVKKETILHKNYVSEQDRRTLIREQLIEIAIVNLLQ